MKTVNIEMPFFPGFYESVFENSDTEYYLIKDTIEYYKEEKGVDLEEGDIEIDYTSRRKDIANVFCDTFKEYAPDFVKEITNNCISSPAQYNFSTDKIYADVTMDDDFNQKMIENIKSNFDWYKERISKDWSSYDGFWSFMPNDVNNWLEELAKDEIDERFISEMLKYMMVLENKKVCDDIVYDVYENIYDNEYISIKNIKTVESK